jgi:hypothetical protein
MMLSRKVGALSASAVMALGVAVPAVAIAGDYCPPPDGKVHCNAGRGNGSEGCDPGNSSTTPETGASGQNQGGDEGGPIQGGTGAP